MHTPRRSKPCLKTHRRITDPMRPRRGRNTNKPPPAVCVDLYDRNPNGGLPASSSTHSHAPGTAPGTTTAAAHATVMTATTIGQCPADRCAARHQARRVDPPNMQRQRRTVDDDQVRLVSSCFPA